MSPKLNTNLETLKAERPSRDLSWSDAQSGLSERADDRAANPPTRDRAYNGAKHATGSTMVIESRITRGRSEDPLGAVVADRISKAVGTCITLLSLDVIAHVLRLHAMVYDE